MINKMCSVMCVRTIVVLLLLVTCSSGRRVTAPVADTVSHIPAIVGGAADLPCDIKLPLPTDVLLLVVWYRDDLPVYSYDHRLNEPSVHWFNPDYQGRINWHHGPGAGLRFTDVQSRDRGIYRCRVDFSESPTNNYLVSLDVVELPNKPVILDENDKEIANTAGPYHEGGDFKLICRVKGGYPSPRIQWLQGDSVIANLRSSETQEPSRSLDLVIKNVTRAHLSTSYTCSADNTLLIPPLKTTVKIDVYLKPLTVEILSREQPLSVGRQAELRCKSTGARPPAVLTWWIGATKMDSKAKETRTNEANETESLLQWMPSKEQNGQILTCRAEHANFSGFHIESKLRMNIYYTPKSTIKLGSNMNPNTIKEGVDVYFSCDVDANPPAYKVVWQHNGSVLQHNPTNGIIVTGNTNLALRNVSRHQAGRYTCTASNVEGDGKSDDLHLHINYKPICKDKEIRIIGAPSQEAVNLVCEVDAYPPPSTFDWSLNNSVGFIKVDPERYTVEGENGRSILTYTPVSDLDYGTISCKATNPGGQQVTPCVYTLRPATRPDGPFNCTVYNLTHDSFDFLCSPGYEGGLQCIYVLEVWAAEGLVVNATSDIPSWKIRRLGPNRPLRLLAYAANARGRSIQSKYLVETRMRLLPRTETQEPWGVNWAVGVFACAAIIIALILCLGFIASRIHPRSSNYEVTLTVPALKTQNEIVQKRISPQSIDDKNPDLIPLSSE